MHIYIMKQRNLYIGFGFVNARFTRYCNQKKKKKININEIQEGNM